MIKDGNPRELSALWDVCAKFIRENGITAPETVYQTDRVAENSLPLIEAICEAVGYADYDEEDAA